MWRTFLILLFASSALCAVAQSVPGGASSSSGAAPGVVVAAPAVVRNPPPVAAIAPGNQATPAQITEYLHLIHLDETLREVLSSSFDSMRKVAPAYLPESFWEDMHKTFDTYDLLPELIPIYQKYISAQDMVAILAFYRTPAGQRMIASQPEMLAESQAHFREIGGRLGSEVGARHEDEIAAARKKYEEDIAKRQKAPSN